MDGDEEPRRLTARLGELAESRSPGWLGQPFDTTIVDLPWDVTRYLVSRCTCESVTPTHRRHHVPAVARFVGSGHLIIDTDARDPAVAAWLPAYARAASTAFRPLIDELGPPATDLAEIRSVLDEAEKQISAVQGGGLPDPSVLVIAVAASRSGEEPR